MRLPSFALLNIAQLGRYIGISGLALALDIAAFMLLIAFAVNPVVASVCGYLAGTQLHWMLSTRMVFAAGVNHDPAIQRRQQLMFFASAVLGISCNGGIVALGETLDAPLFISKALAIATSFVLVLVLRASIIFGRRYS